MSSYNKCRVAEMCEICEQCDIDTIGYKKQQLTDALEQWDMHKYIC